RDYPMIDAPALDGRARAPHRATRLAPTPRESSPRATSRDGRIHVRVPVAPPCKWTDCTVAIEARWAGELSLMHDTPGMCSPGLPVGAGRSMIGRVSSSLARRRCHAEKAASVTFPRGERKALD